jgi:hypothetical protein
MNDPVSTARDARQNLARGLAALQAPGVPASLMDVAEPVAEAMSALHRIESSQGAALADAAPTALVSVRRALGMLQAQPVGEPAVDLAIESVAGSLSLVHALNQSLAAAAPPPAATPQYAPQAAAQYAAPAAPQYAEPAAYAPPAPTPQYAEPARVVPEQPQAYAPAPQYAPPAAAYGPPPGAPYAAAPQPQGFGGTMAMDQGHPAQPPAPPYQAAYPPPPQVAQHGPAPAPYAFPIGDAAQQPAAQPWNAPPVPAWGPPAPAAGSAPAHAPPQPYAAPSPAEPGPYRRIAAPAEAIRVEADLGAHSATNFYKGLSGNDVIDSGGIFIATYQIPKLGQTLVIKVSLPGGYEFEALGEVTWTRDAPLSGAGLESPPGFGARFTDISPEGRQLVYRYVRNREPLFHDDL